MAFVMGALPAPPVQVLEIGAGKGEVAAALSDAGYAITAIDPAAEPGGIVARCSLLEARGSFDVAVAVVSLHHIDPLEESCAHLATLLPPGAQLVIDELDIDRYDERAMRWWHSQRQALGLGSNDHDHGPLEILDHMRAHIHPLESVCAALRPYFELGQPVRGPYLHRWELRPSLYEVEVDLIAAGLIPAVGARLIATRTA
ncbi:MAG TPA: class I SAM-dependent methyltransferase [Solirubrobacteraceae bacterium]|nr:class I SAM-dependent methyltransferase [Solirubrobacteraceae bacterium]